MVTDHIGEEAVFNVARKIADATARSEYLRQVCGQNEKLLARVEALLKAHEAEGSFLDGPPAEATMTVFPPITEGPGTVIGKYKILQQIGEGGFGVVYMAEQSAPVRRKVALKIIKPGMDTKQVIARFEAERQALALMDHPNIARVLDAGATETGCPYFVMDLVKGVPLTEYCDKNELATEDRLQLFIEICRAVQHAHQKGVIHRDIKPSNVLVTLHDGQPVPKVIDFGVSKAINQQLTEKTLFTSYGQMVGTPQYMSPEQAEMSGLDVDTRSDVYSLGVLLYELLTATTPLEGERLRTAGYGEMQRIIREEEPPKPSVRLSTSGEQLTIIAKHRSIDPKRHQQLIRGELDWIVMKSLEKDRGRRYESPSALAADVERFLTEEPVEACPPSTAYRIRKFVCRNKVPVAAALAISVTLILGITLATTGMVHAQRLAEREKRARRESVAAKERAEYEATRAQSERVRAESERKRAEKAAFLERESRNEAERQRERLARLLYVADMKSAMQAWEDYNPRLVRETLHRHRIELNQHDLLGFEWYYLWELWKRDQNPRSIPLPAFVVSIAVSPDGKYLAARHGHGSYVTLWDLATGAPANQFGKEDRNTWLRTGVTFSPDGRFLAFASADPTRLTLCDLVENEESESLGSHDGSIRAVVFTRNGAHIATGAEDKTIRIWDVNSLRESARLEGHTDHVECLAFSRNHKLLVSGGEDAMICLWDSETHKKLLALPGHSGPVIAVSFSPDGNYLASGSEDHTVKIWDLETHENIETLTGFSDEVRTVAFSSSGKYLATGCRDGSIRVWQLPHFSQVETFRGYGRSFALAFVPRTETLAFGAQERRVVLREFDTESESDLLQCGGPVRHLAWSNDSTRLAAISTSADMTPPRWDPGRHHPPSNKVAIWGLDNGEMRALPSLDNGAPIGCFAISRQGKVAVSEHENRRIQIWELDSGDHFKSLLDREGIEYSSLAFSTNGKRLAAGSHNGAITMWDIESGRRLYNSAEHGHRVTCLDFSADGKTLASGSADRTVRLWDVETGNMIRNLGERSDMIMSLAFSAHNNTLAVALDSNDIELWNLSAKQEPRVLKGHGVYPSSVVFSKDGNTLFSSGADGVVRLWDVSSGLEKLAINAASPALESLALAPNERILAAGGRDGIIQLWYAASEEDVRDAGW